MIKGALGAPEGHQVDTRFVLGQKFRKRKRDVHHRKALEIWPILVINISAQDQRYDKKTKKLGHFWQIPLF